MRAPAQLSIPEDGMPQAPETLQRTGESAHLPFRAAAVPPITALERDFPAAEVGLLAEHESWRKEVHRPATHTHKWWAQRLGTVFRGILAAAVTESQSEALAAYGSAMDLDDLVVFDPFAGSGTTLVEGRKAGATVIGRDINPVATLVQRQALQRWDPFALARAYDQVEAACREDIDRLHRTESGEDVLYYFWVSLADCPECGYSVELFSSHVFGRHAYPRKYPTARAVCPNCHEVHTIDLSSDEQIKCGACGTRSSLTGAVSGQRARCRSGHSFRIVDALTAGPPRTRMFAKLVLSDSGRRVYRSIDDFDRDLYAQAEGLLSRDRRLLVPVGSLDAGVNTRQAMRWGFTEWSQFFNARQLYSLGRLGASIRDLEHTAEREALIALFSGVLEFNNLFCSYKGEGTGAVRHMFSHHVLKPERIPLEAHPWGTPSSSGAFSTLFQSRLQRALTYKAQPHDSILSGDGAPVRVVGLSQALEADRVDEPAVPAEGGVGVRTGDSSDTGLPDGSVDLVITDPPFMDNVHYSELADFFHAWLRGLDPFAGYPCERETTRITGEVQSESPEDFGLAIARVWRECARVLKDDGLLAFTFHQARVGGWVALIDALTDAGLVVTAIQPTKAEMSVGAPKSGASEPSNLDSIVVCRKRAHAPAVVARPELAAETAASRLRQLSEAGIGVGPTDVRSVVWGSVLATATAGGAPVGADLLEKAQRLAEQVVLERQNGAPTAG